MNESVRKDVEFFDRMGILPGGGEGRGIDDYLRTAEKKFETLEKFGKEPEKFLNGYLIREDLEISELPEGIKEGFRRKFDTEPFPFLVIGDEYHFEAAWDKNKTRGVEINSDNFLLEIYPDFYVLVSSTNYFQRGNYRISYEEYEKNRKDQVLANCLSIKAQTSDIHDRIERIFLRDGRRKNSKADKESFIHEYEKKGRRDYFYPSLATFGFLSFATGNPLFLAVGGLYGYIFTEIDTIYQARKLLGFLEKCEREGLNPLYLLLRGNIRDYVPNGKTNILDQLRRLGVRGEVIKYSLGLE